MGSGFFFVFVLLYLDSILASRNNGGVITSFFVSITLNRQKDKDKKRQKKTKKDKKRHKKTKKDKKKSKKDKKRHKKTKKSKTYIWM